MRFKKLKMVALSVALGLRLMMSNGFVTQVEASTGFVPNSYSTTSPYGFVWSNTNGAQVDATAYTQGMFNFNYDFTSGSDWNTALGQPTTYDGTVNINVFNANVRADKNTALIPPQYGIFSGEFMTGATNPFFSQPVNANYWYVNTTQDPSGLSTYDTLQQGINSQQTTLGQQGQITVNPNGAGGFLTPTSVK